MNLGVVHIHRCCLNIIHRNGKLSSTGGGRHSRLTRPLISASRCAAPCRTPALIRFGLYLRCAYVAVYHGVGP